MRVRAGVVTAAVALSVLAGCTAEQSHSNEIQSNEMQSGEGRSSAAEPAIAQDGAARAAAAPGADLAAAQPVTVVRQVVRNADIEIRVGDLAAATDRVRRIAPGHGGFVTAERSGPERASLTLRVAADELDATLAALAALGEVDRRELRVEDVTEQSIDLQSRLESQRASVERVRALLGRAGTIREIVQVESELTWRQAELESLQQRGAALADQVALATVEVGLTGSGGEPVAGSGFGSGLSAGWDALRAAGTALLTVLGAVLPFAVLLAVPGGLAALWWRRRRRAAAVEG